MTTTPEPVKPPVGERVFAWLAYGLMAVGTLLLLVLSVFSVFATDSCGSTGQDLRVCDGDYFASALFTLWGAMAVVLVAVLVLMIRGIVRRRRIWFHPVLGLVVQVLLGIAYLSALSL